MATVGETLRATREARNLTLEEISAAIRVQLRFLKMLEEDDLGTMPEESYFLGFLSSYASFLGLSSSELCRQFLSQFRDLRKVQKVPKKTEPGKTPTPSIPDQTSLTPPALPSLPPQKTPVEKPRISPQDQPAPPPVVPIKEEPKITLDEETPASPTPSSQPSKPSPPLFFYFIIALILLVGLYFSFPYLKKAYIKNKEMPPKPSPVTQAPPPPGPQPLVPLSTPTPPPTQPLTKEPPIPSPPPPPAPAAAAKPAPAAPRLPLRLEARASENVWVGIRIDGAGPRRELTLKKGERAAWEAKERFDVTVGNAGGVELFLNGKSLGILGKPGQVLTDIHLTKEGRQ